MLNRYSYVRNNPLNFVDPSGYKKRRFFRVVFAAVAAVIATILTGGNEAVGAQVFVAVMSIGGAAVGDQVGAAVDRQAASAASADPGASGPRASPSATPAAAPLGHGVSFLGPERYTDIVASETLQDSWGPDDAIFLLTGLGVSARAAVTAAREFGPAILLGLRSLGETGAIRLGAEEAGSRGAIVIGENMEERVIPYAKKIGADWYRARGKNPLNWMRNNREALRTWMAKDKEIIDIGPDLIRRKVRGPSPNYEMETRILRKRRYPVTWDPQP